MVSGGPELEQEKMLCDQEKMSTATCESEQEMMLGRCSEQEQKQLSSESSDSEQEKKMSCGSSASDGSEESVQDYPKLQYQYSTPLSAVPHHMKNLKGTKAVKFLSPAGVTPVTMPKYAQPEDTASPASLMDLDHISCIKSPVQMNSSSPHYHSPQNHVSGSPISPPLTPFRTPKSVARKAGGQSDGRILGTPDYLAPELLLRKAHDSGVDWWAVGVCLYEFMTGIPPFNDSTPDLVFNNILSLNIEWPEDDEALSEPAVQAIMAFLTVDQKQRANGESIRKFSLMKDVDLENILDQTAPFIPQPDDASDTTYFSTRNSMQGLKVSQVDL